MEGVLPYFLSARAEIVKRSESAFYVAQKSWLLHIQVSRQTSKQTNKQASLFITVYSIR